MSILVRMIVSSGLFRAGFNQKAFKHRQGNLRTDRIFNIVIYILLLIISRAAFFFIQGGKIMGNLKIRQSSFKLQLYNCNP